MARSFYSLLIAINLVLTSFNSPVKTCYGYAVVASADHKTIYISSVFSYNDKDYYSLGKWADTEFTDYVSGFKSGGSQIYPAYAYTRTDKEKVKEQRARLIVSKRNIGTQSVEQIPFPSSKD